MNKSFRITVFAVLVSMLFSMMPSAFASGEIESLEDLVAGYTVSEIAYSVDFEDTNDFDISYVFDMYIREASNYCISTSRGSATTEVIKDDNLGNVVKITKPADGYTMLNMLPKISSDIVVMSYKFRVEDFNTQRVLFYTMPGLSGTQVGSTPVMTLLKSTADTSMITIAGQKFNDIRKCIWYNVSQAFDRSTGNLYYFLNDALLYTVQVTAEADSIYRSMFRIENCASGDSESVTFIDDIKCCGYSKTPQILFTEYSDGKIIFQTSERIDVSTLNSENVMVVVGDELIPVVGLEADADEPTYTLTLAESLGASLEVCVKFTDGLLSESGNPFTIGEDIEFFIITPPAEAEKAEPGVARGTISFPDNAYLYDGELIVDVWANGDVTDEYLKQEFIINTLDDIDFQFEFPEEENAVGIRVMVRNLSGASTNLYTETASGLDFVLTYDGMEPDEYQWENLIAIDELPDMEITIPCGKTIKGTIFGSDFRAVDNAFMTIMFDTIHWTRACIDSKTNEYTALMPYGLSQGTYYPYIEVNSEGATNNALCGTYYYNEGSAISVNPMKNMTGLDFTVDTGYTISGVVTVPDDAVFDNYEVYCELPVGDETYYITGVTTKLPFSETNREIPFLIGVDRDETLPSSTLAMTVHGGIADDMLGEGSYSNVLTNAVYYYSEAGTTLDEADADVVSFDCNRENIRFDLQTGAFLNLKVSVPEEINKTWIDFDFCVVSEDGDFVAQTDYASFNPNKDVTEISLVVPRKYIGEYVYYMYKVGYDTYGDYPELYTGKAYINFDGTVTGFRKDADKFTLTDDNSVELTFALASEVDIPDILSGPNGYLESSHPFISANSESVYYYDSENAENLKVTFSPLSWITEYAQITICDAESNVYTYTAAEFNQKISGETIDITGPKFTVDISSRYAPPYMRDYGFAIVGIESGESEEIVEFLPGDVNGDGRVNRLDLLRLGKYLSAWDVVVDEKAADIVPNGAVNRLDLLRLGKYLSGWDVKLGE